MSRVAAALCGAQIKSFLQGLKPHSRHQVMPGLKPRPPKEKAKDRGPKKRPKENAQRKDLKKAPNVNALKRRLTKRLDQGICENDPKAPATVGGRYFKKPARDGCDGLGQQGGGN